MSIRIHELAKRYNMEGKDLLALLKERGWVSADTKSVSSTGVSPGDIRKT